MMLLQLIFKINFTRAHFSDFVFLFFFFKKNISSLVFSERNLQVKQKWSVKNVFEFLIRLVEMFRH